MRFSLLEQAFFAQRLAFLIEGDMPLTTALAACGQQMKSREARRVTEALRAEVSAGQSLSGAMRRQSGAFGTMAVTLVSVGESCGILGKNLQHLADELKKRERLRKKVLGALAYPVVVLAATCGVVTYLLAALLPKLLPVFAEMHAQLPMSTRLVIAASRTLRKHGLMMFAVTAGLATTLVWAVRRSARMRERAELALLRVPVAGTLLRHVRIVRMCRALGLLLCGGLTLRDACMLAADAGPRAGTYDAHLRAMADAVNQGKPLSWHLSRHPALFPELVAQMVASGEESGKLPQAFLYLADHYDREIDDLTGALSTLLEPALMLCTGAAVGFIAMAVITPMYSLTQSLHA